jgi:hypothetical protein
MSGSMRRPRATALALLLLTLTLALAAVAKGELTEKGDLFIRFDGGISPRTLPRNALAPIAVRIEGTIKSLSRRHPPTLRRIRIALNKTGRLSTIGLPRCHRNQIEPAIPSRALRVCGQALVGGGGYTVRTTIQNQPSTVSPGEILLFNTELHGHNAILALMYETEPAPLSRFVYFHIRHVPGQFGTVLTGRFTEGIARNGYLRSIFLQLRRLYEFRGRPRSYLSASCAAPRGIHVASFPFAQASMSFDDGRTLSSTLTRSCRVTGG